MTTTAAKKADGNEHDQSDISSQLGPAKMSRRQLLLLISLALSNFTAYLAFSVIAPFFPQDATAKGASDTIIGFIFGSFEATICIVSPIYGSYVAAVGPKRMFLLGTFMCSVCITSFGFLDKSPDGVLYIILCFACRIFDANGTAMVTTASFTMVANEFPLRRSIVMGVLEVAVGAGLIIGPLVGGLLYSVGGYQLPFIVVGAAQLLSCAVCFWTLPTIESVVGTKRFVSLLKIPTVVQAFLLIFSATFSLTFLDPTLAKHSLEIEPSLGHTAIGAIFLAICTTYALATPLIGYLCDKGYLKSVVIVGCILSAAGLLGSGPSPLLPFLPRKVWLLVVFLAIFGLGYAASWLPTFQMILTSAIENGYEDGLDTYGMVSGLFSAGSAMGSFAGPSVAGYLVQHIGFSWAATICAFLSLLMAATTLLSVIAHMSYRLGYRRETSAEEERTHLLVAIGEKA